MLLLVVVMCPVETSMISMNTRKINLMFLSEDKLSSLCHHSLFFYVMNNGLLHNDVNGQIKPQRDVNFQVNVAEFFRQFTFNRIFNFFDQYLNFFHKGMFTCII